MAIDMDKPFAQFAEDHLCTHGVPKTNVCDTCELGPMPMKKPTLEQVAWIFEQINENAGGSFRKLIYDRLGFGPNAYSELHSAGGQNITNAMALELHAFLPEENLYIQENAIDSMVSQIEVLYPVYEAAKILRGACFFGKRENIEAASLALRKAVDLAARELEDSDE